MRNVRGRGLKVTTWCRVVDMEIEKKRISVLVADSGAFIKGAPLEKWSSKVVTVSDVISEIRDKATRERLQVLPYDLTFREPSADSLQHVTGFAKKTGDYGALSSVDLKLISLTYQLHCELDPQAASQLRQEPLKQQVAERGEKSLKIAGFYSPHKKSVKRTESTPSNGGDESNNDRSKEEEEGCIELVEQVEGLKMENSSEPEEREEEEDEDGWITPDNLQQVCEEMGGVLDEIPESLSVGCITTDFAMQNVLLQMGLSLISLEGKRIRQLRTYAKKCKGCFNTTMDTSQVWCPRCGNHSLYRVSVTVDTTGRMQYRPLSSKQFSHRGLRYSMSAPKSGRHAHNPVLAPDQQVTYRERRRRENKVDPLSPDYVTLSSPFAVHDVTSRGARLAMGAGGQSSRGGDRRRNPNVVQPKGRRKK